MSVKVRCLMPALAAVLVGLLAAPAVAHDGPKSNAGNGGPTPGGSGASFTSYRMQMASRLDLTQLGAPDADANQFLASAWGWVDTLDNADPSDDREYALMARRSDLAIVDITVPTAPVLIGNVQRTAGTAATTWRDVRVIGNWAYVGVDSATHGVQSFDLTRVRGVTTPTLFNADAVFLGTAEAPGMSNVHSFAVNHTASTPYLYAAGSNTRSGLPNAPQTPGGLQIIDTTDPMNLSIAGSWQDDGYIHETSVFTYHGPDQLHFGKSLAFNCTGNGGDPAASPNSFSITDVSNPASVLRLSQHRYADTGYTHQGWLTDDHEFFLINDELDETGNLTGSKTRTHMYDVRDIDNPIYRGFFEWGIGAIDHNLYVAGDYIFQAHYTRGVRVFEIGDLDSLDPNDWLTEVAWFDSYPQDDSKSFNGVWQVYPYLPSGSIIASDINGGLFVLQMVPEPGSLALLSLGALALLRRRR